MEFPEISRAIVLICDPILPVELPDSRNIGATETPRASERP